MGLRIFSKISNGIHRHIYFQKYVMEPIAIYVYIYMAMDSITDFFKYSKSDIYIYFNGLWEFLINFIKWDSCSLYF